MMGNKDVMDTPFSVTSYTAKTLADLQTVTVADALQRDPSVRSTGQTGGIVDSFFIRGFAIGEGNLGELAYDGVYWRRAQLIAPLPSTPNVSKCSRGRVP